MTARQKHRLSPLQFKLTLEQTDIELVHEHHVLSAINDAEIKWELQNSRFLIPRMRECSYKCHTHSLTHSHILTQSLTDTFHHPLAHTFTHSRVLTYSHPHSRTHKRADTCTHTHTHTHARTHARTHTHSHTHVRQYGRDAEKKGTCLP